MLKNSSCAVAALISNKTSTTEINNRSPLPYKSGSKQACDERKKKDFHPLLFGGCSSPSPVLKTAEAWCAPACYVCMCGYNGQHPFILLVIAATAWLAILVADESKQSFCVGTSMLCQQMKGNFRTGPPDWTQCQASSTYAYFLLFLCYIYSEKAPFNAFLLIFFFWSVLCLNNFYWKIFTGIVNWHNRTGVPHISI